MSNAENIIVIGGGVSGCSAAALLASKGKQVTLIEKNSFWGGKAGTQTPLQWGWTKESFSDYKVDFGHHVLGAGGFLEKLLRETKVWDKLNIQLLPMASFYRSGKLHSSPTNILQAITAYSYAGIIEKIKMLKVQNFVKKINVQDTINKYAYVPLGEFLKPFNLGKYAAEILIEGFAGGYQTIVDLNKNSAADFILCIKLFLKGVQKYKTTAVLYPFGGFGNIAAKFAEFVNNNNGQSKLNSNLEKINFEKNEKGEYQISSVIVNGEEIKTNEVIFSESAYFLKNYVDAEVQNKYKEFFNKADEGKKEATKLLVVLCGSKKSLTKKSVNTWIFVPRAELKNFSEYFLISELDSTLGVAPAGTQIITFATLMPELKEDIKILGDKMFDDMERLFPNFSRKDCEWIHYLYCPIVDGIGRTIDWYGEKRLPAETPIKGLYLCGDSAQTYSTGTDGCASSAYITAEKILKQKLISLDEMFN